MNDFIFWVTAVCVFWVLLNILFVFWWSRYRRAQKDFAAGKKAGHSSFEQCHLDPQTRNPAQETQKNQTQTAVYSAVAGPDSCGNSRTVALSSYRRAGLEPGVSFRTREDRPRGLACDDQSAGGPGKDAQKTCSEAGNSKAESE